MASHRSVPNEWRRVMASSSYIETLIPTSFFLALWRLRLDELRHHSGLFRVRPSRAAALNVVGLPRARM